MNEEERKNILNLFQPTKKLPDVSSISKIRNNHTKETYTNGTESTSVDTEKQTALLKDGIQIFRKKTTTITCFQNNEGKFVWWQRLEEIEDKTFKIGRLIDEKHSRAIEYHDVPTWVKNRFWFEG